MQVEDKFHCQRHANTISTAGVHNPLWFARRPGSVEQKPIIVRCNDFRVTIGFCTLHQFIVIKISAFFHFDLAIQSPYHHTVLCTGLLQNLRFIYSLF